ncbi:hypothetical protein SH584_09510 [Sphingomonas sp. LY29]|jgi:hypothetical protein|uniref:hypothetical protein n=1 Tax=unclassified Sphingomonas TaxID=196159 RepID=UPI002ADEE060|nr:MULTISPECIES: hypothetical protein [unclassified Sphingomonas]MEA1072036.1 hypothetical protein [Sphingomonas sp. LY160]WRP25280.1 hypothetical protein SH584_09510 [Sphingomonas sp. LY29]
MKKQLFMTSAMAATLMATSGCSSNDGWDDQEVYAATDTAVCVDGNGSRIDDDLCNDNSYRGGSGAYWYFLGRNSAVPYYGDSIHDRRFVGSRSRRPGASYALAPMSTKMTRSQAVSRGGFGSRSRSFGSGRS